MKKSWLKEGLSLHNDDGEGVLESFIYFLQTTFATELRGGKSWKMEFTVFCASPTSHHLPLAYFHSDFPDFCISCVKLARVLLKTIRLVCGLKKGHKWPKISALLKGRVRNEKWKSSCA